jgi:flagellar basal-body rod protein FlgB
MSSGLLGITSELVTLALDAASARQQACAQNIANVGTPGFVPYEARFEGRLDQLQAKLRDGGKLSQSDLSPFRARIEPISVESGLTPKVALDMEAEKLSETALQYQAVTRAYNQMTSLLSIAINDGRR